MPGISRFLTTLSISVTVALGLSSGVHAQDRLALFLERSVSPVPSDVENALTSAGYSVIKPGVANGDGIRWAVDLFRRRLDRSGPGSIGIVYVQLPGATEANALYLIPPSLESVAGLDVATDGYPVDHLLNSFSSLADTPVAIVLDICPEDNAQSLTTPPFPAVRNVLLADCRTSGGSTAGLRSMGSSFAEAILAPGLTLNDIVARTDRGGPPPALASISGAPGSNSDTNATDAADNGLEDVLWNAIRGTEDESVLQEYLTRFPDGKYVAEAKARLLALNPTKTTAAQPAPGSAAPAPTPESVPPTAQAQAQAEAIPSAEAEKTETANDAVGDKLASRVETEPVPRQSLTSLPQTGTKSFTGIMSGTDATGWGNLYRRDCGSDVGYRLTMSKTGESWQAVMTRMTDGMTMRFTQRDRIRDDGVVLLYASSEGAKVTLKVRPQRSERATYSIPTAGIGSCAVGLLN